MPSNQDTIAALATPAGAAAIALIRISGPDTFRVATALAGAPPRPRAARHGDYRALGGELIDDVVFIFFKGPASYTGEDSLEVSCHGNPFIVQKLLADLFARGCRPAEAGEFTQRAFLNGRLDLSQAEAVMDLIQARSERALAAANAQLRGALGRRIEELVQAVLTALARIEAYIDFPDEDLPREDIALLSSTLNNILRATSDLIATSRYGELLREGVRTIIIGAPNAGKSSLLNALVGHDRALVSPEPGTTRDFIEERLVVGPHSLRLIDTAGLNPLPSSIERMGMAKTIERAAEADLFMFVVDASVGRAPDLPADVANRMTPKNTLVVLNKTDLPCPLRPAHLPVGIDVVEVSAVTRAGLEALRAQIVAQADQLAFVAEQDVAIAINARHAHALSQARAALIGAATKLQANAPAELISSDLNAALAAFGEITGRIDNERMLDALFASFCIGK